MTASLEQMDLNNVEYSKKKKKGFWNVLWGQKSIQLIRQASTKHTVNVNKSFVCLQKHSTAPLKYHLD